MIVKLQNKRNERTWRTQNIYCSIQQLLLTHNWVYYPMNLLHLIGRLQFIYVSIVSVGFGKKKNELPNSHNIKCHFHFVYTWVHIKVILRFFFFFPFNIFSCCITLHCKTSWLFIHWQTSYGMLYYMGQVYVYYSDSVGVTWSKPIVFFLQ